MILTTIDVPEHILTDLKTRYSEPHRFYHNWDHVYGMFETACIFGFDLSPAQEWAILFHDAVYKVGDPNNEYKSGLLMAKMLDGIVKSEIINKAFDIIYSTKFHTCDQVQLCSEFKAVLDLDLYGLSTKQCPVNSINVWNEVKTLPDYETNKFSYLEKRLGFLRAMLAREKIYYTDKFDERMARYNMGYELAIFENFL